MKSLLTRFAGAFLLASGFFALAAILAFGTFGRQTPLGYAFAVGGLVSLIAWFWGRKADPSARPSDQFSRQRTWLGINTFISLVLLELLLVGVNYVAQRHHKTFDLSRNRINSLSPQTDNALQKLPGTVRLSYFYATTQPDVTVQSLLETYARASDKIRIEFVSALREPFRVPPTFNGSPLLSAQLEKDGKTAQKQEISVADEQNVTSALLKLITPQPRTLYFLTGHGEVPPTQLAALQAALEAQNYSLKVLSLLPDKAKIPTDCAALVILAPQVDLGEKEAKVLGAYTLHKGRIALFLSPLRQKLPRLEALVKSLGVGIGFGLVADMSGNGTLQQPIGSVGDPTRFPLLRGVAGDVVFLNAVPLHITVAPNSGVTPVFQTSDSAQTVNGSGAQKGPFDLAIAVEHDGARTLISSSAHLAVGEGLNVYGNKSFVLASINWAVGNDALVSIPPKQPITNRLEMPDTTMRFAGLFCVLVMPVILLLIGGAVWWRRR